MNFNMLDTISTSNQIVVPIGEVMYSDEESTLVTYALGSCVGMAAYDPIAKAGALLHFMLPNSEIDKKKSITTPFMFADTGITRTLYQLKMMGCMRSRLIVKIAGGANIMDPRGIFDIGKRNLLAIKKILWKHNIIINGKDIGGNIGRNMTLNLKTNTVSVRYNGQREEFFL